MGTNSIDKHIKSNVKLDQNRQIRKIFVTHFSF
jgi:hypothetical protein